MFNSGRDSYSFQTEYRSVLSQTPNSAKYLLGVDYAHFAVHINLVFKYILGGLTIRKRI